MTTSDPREVMEQAGVDVDCTPVDTAMSWVGLGLCHGFAAAYPDEEPEQ